MMKRPLILLSLFLAASLGCSQPPSEEGAAPIVILGATLLDGTGAPPVEDSVIVIRGRQIESAGPRSHTPVPKGGEMIDGSGKVVIPGLIDLHCHYFGDRAEVERQFRAQLYFGVTTARSIGVDPEENLVLFAQARAHQIPAPRLYTAGLGFTHPEGHPVEIPTVNRPANVEEAGEMVRQLAQQKVDFVKMWVDSLNQTVPKISEEIRTTVVREAESHGIPSVAHISDEADVRQLADLGVVDFLHTVRDREPMEDTFVDMCRSRGISFSPTLSVAEGLWYLAEHPEALEDRELRRAFAPDVLERLTDTRSEILANPQLPRLKTEYARAERFVKQMQEAGVVIALGSDSGAGNVATGWGTHHEMELLVQAGLSPMQALVAATGNAARVVGRGQSNFGLLAAGQAADLILLNADPRVDIRNTRRIDRVMQGGEWLNRASLFP